MDAPPPPSLDWVVMACGVCGGDWDDWHESRKGRAVWSTSCRVDRAIHDWLSSIRRPRKRR